MFLNALVNDAAAKSIIKSRAEPSRAEPSRAEPSRAEPSRAEPSRAEPSAGFCLRSTCPPESLPAAPAGARPSGPSGRPPREVCEAPPSHGGAPPALGVAIAAPAAMLTGRLAAGRASAVRSPGLSGIAGRRGARASSPRRAEGPSWSARARRSRFRGGRGSRKSARAGSPRLHGTSDHPLIRGRGPPARGQAPSSAAQYNPLQKEPAPGPATPKRSSGRGSLVEAPANRPHPDLSATMFPARQRSGHRCEYSQAAEGFPGFSRARRSCPRGVGGSPRLRWAGSSCPREVEGFPRFLGARCVRSRGGVRFAGVLRAGRLRFRGGGLAWGSCLRCRRASPVGWSMRWRRG